MHSSVDWFKGVEMENNNTYLGLFLDAPLQSWGYASRFDQRTSLSFPTRSGIIGMICAAMGIERGDVGSLHRFEKIGMKSYTFLQNGRLVDFHTVGGGFDPKTGRWQMVRKANEATPTTVVTRREYLVHTRFGVILTGLNTFLEKISAALQNPKWGIWLGRKSCIPASPVFVGLFADEASALDRLKEVAQGNEVMGIVSEADTFKEGVDTIMDVPIDFASRRFAHRRVSMDIPQKKI